MKLSHSCVPRLVRGAKNSITRSWPVLLGVLFVAASIPAFAQEATIVGTVTDPTGSVVPNVTITLTNTDTSVIRTIQTNDAGEYVAPDMHIGHYTAKAEGQGFSTAEKTGLVLSVGDRLRVDFAMKMGAATERVTVEAATVAVQTDTGEVSDLISGQQITKLESNGRNIYSLVNLTPGASSEQSDFIAPVPVGGDADVSFNGQRPGHNIYLMDGGEDLDRGGAGNFSVMPSLESLAEFRVLSSNYSAEYGLSSSATMTTVVKSGSNQFHGSGWWFGRNDALDSRNYFNPAPQKVAELRFNTYGFNIGGPVDFKKSDHKTFFFYNMEWRSLIQGQTLNTNVPLPSTYGGNFGSTLINVPGLTQEQPSTLFAHCPGGVAPAGVVQGQPFPNNTIPACMLDPNAQALLGAKIFPAPTSGNQFLGGNNAPTTVREEIVRADHRFNDKFSVFGHWVSEQISQTYGTSQWSGDNVPTIGDTFGNPSYSAVVHATHTIRPNLLNEIAFNYNGNRINIIPKAGFGAPLSAPSGFTFNRIFSGPNPLNRIPSINLSLTNTNYTVNWMPWVNKADDYQIRDDVSWVKGAHQLKIGGSWALYKKIQDVFANTEGNFTFNGFFTKNDFADFLLGDASGYSEDAVHDNGHWNSVSWAAYVQDNWRVNNRLTLNLGLRWDGAPHTYEALHRSSNFYPNLYNPANAATFDNSGNICSGAGNGCVGPSPGLGTSPNSILAGYQFYLNGIGIDGKNGIPKGLVDSHWANFGPRFGFAYDLSGQGKTVIRGGFGMMYERIQGNDMYNGGTNVPFSANASFSNVSLSNPHTNVTSGTSGAVPIVVPSITGVLQSNYKNPTSYQYSAGVQQSLGPRSVLSVSYVGNQNRHLSDYEEINLPPASSLAGLITSGGTGYNQLVPYRGFRSLKMAQNEADSHYNSLQVDLHANVRRDLELQFGYTYSRAIDAFEAGSSGGDLGSVSNPYAGWRYDVGPGAYDRTHVAFVNYVYQLPVFKNSSNRLVKGTLGGWELAGIVTIESGAPFDVTLGGSQGSNGVQNGTNRPDLLGAVHYVKQRSSAPFGMQWIDASGLAAPAIGSWGTLPHNYFRGPGRDNWNIALHKTFAFTERAGLEFRVETFNTWNHTQFRANFIQGGINNTFTGSNFGLITSAYDPREIQLGAKLFF